MTIGRKEALMKKYFVIVEEMNFFYLKFFTFIFKIKVSMNEIQLGEKVLLKETIGYDILVRTKAH